MEKNFKEVPATIQEQRTLNQYKLTLPEAKTSHLGLHQAKMVAVSRKTMCYKCGQAQKEGSRMVAGTVKIYRIPTEGSYIRKDKVGFMCPDCFSKHILKVATYDRQLREVYGLDSYVASF